MNWEISSVCWLIEKQKTWNPPELISVACSSLPRSAWTWSLPLSAWQSVKLYRFDLRSPSMLGVCCDVSVMCFLCNSVVFWMDVTDFTWCFSFVLDNTQRKRLTFSGIIPYAQIPKGFIILFDYSALYPHQHQHVSLLLETEASLLRTVAERTAMLRHPYGVCVVAREHPSRV